MNIQLIIFFRKYFVCFVFILFWFLFLNGCDSNKGEHYPTGTSTDYWAQLEKGELTPDVLGHWAHILVVADYLNYSQKPYFDVPDPYDMNMYKNWVEKNEEILMIPGTIFPVFSGDTDDGWPAEIQGVPWTCALMGISWAAPSVAIIEPKRTAEAVFIIENAIKVLRSPAAWLDYVVGDGWGDPMLDNIMWKGPLLIAEGLYALVSGDKEKYKPEITAIARNLYELQKSSLESSIGKGFSGGVCCEPNQWFPQCNTFGAGGLLLYDKVYGKDKKHDTYIGKEYSEHLINYLKKYMIDPKSGLAYRSSHPYGPMIIDKNVSANTNVFASIWLSLIDPEFGKSTWEILKRDYIKDDQEGNGAYMIDYNSENSFNQNFDDLGYPSMMGEAIFNVFLAPAAARVYDDKETFDKLHEYLNENLPPNYYMGEVRFDEFNTDETGIPNSTYGRLLNMYSGWWLFFKVHLGWDTILNHDWSKHRDKNGLLLQN